MGPATMADAAEQLSQLMSRVKTLENSISQRVVPSGGVPWEDPQLSTICQTEEAEARPLRVHYSGYAVPRRSGSRAAVRFVQALIPLCKRPQTLHVHVCHSVRLMI